MARIGLIGGSFNPAHQGHRHISIEALRRLALDEVWWLVSPQNPLKDKAGMAPLAARMESARRAARHPRIRPTDIEASLGTVYTADSIAALRRAFPQHRFIWIMGADNLLQFSRWKRWRDIAREVPIAVMARGDYIGRARRAPAMAWLRRHIRGEARAKLWAEWELPAIVILSIPLDPTSATAIRTRDPGWASRIGATNPKG
ncbi:nicotinate-nucleotide adenylyltransferase [Sphingosinicella sp.]|uniref:nicotinate-nucleotide adenylyltransferase n=1 Tax=Sphingosinicella sp. TaxID=1917971 RepID=UPI0035AE2F07